MQQTISEMTFGEYDAFDENAANTAFFQKSFVAPISLSLSTLRNNKNYIIVGKKGAGKTAAQLFLRKSLEEKGYITNFFSFFNDLTSEHYLEFSKAQKIDFLKIDYKQINAGLSNFYDYRSLWERVFLTQLCQCMKQNGIENKYTIFIDASIKGDGSILDSVVKSLKLELKIPLRVLSAKISCDLSKLGANDKQVDLATYNQISKDLLKDVGQSLRIYMFADELVFSKLNTRSDEIKVRSALIRDLLRAANSLNNFMTAANLDIHFVCTLRPEIRDLLNEEDAEISKTIDSKAILLHWNSEDGVVSSEEHILIRILKNKIIHGSSEKIDFDNFFDHQITFNDHSIPIFDFILNSSWFRPRDMVRFLKSYQKMNPSHKRFSEAGVKNALNEYARVSAKEALDELAVNYDADVVSEIKNRLRQREYQNFDDFLAKFGVIHRVDIGQLCKDMFVAGIIGNVDGTGKSKRYYWHHRGEEYFTPTMRIYVHSGLWNYFNLR